MKTGIRKFFDIVSEMKDAISLGVGEPDFDTPWHIRDEGIYSLEKGKTFYTSNSGLMELRQEICHYLKRTIHTEYDPKSEVIITVGGSEGIDIALRAMLDPGDEVLIPQPSYVSYEPCTILAGGKPVIINLKVENEFRLTAQEILDACTEKTKVLVLPFPNNPTGAIMERSDLEAIAKVIEEKDLLVITDEIYSELSYKDKHVSIVEMPGMRERTILINGFSKAYAMTGWRLGYACGPKAVIEQMTKIHQFCIMCAPTTSQYAAVEALKNGDVVIADTITTIIYIMTVGIDNCNDAPIMESKIVEVMIDIFVFKNRVNTIASIGNGIKKELHSSGIIIAKEIVNADNKAIINKYSFVKYVLSK